MARRGLAAVAWSGSCGKAWYGLVRCGRPGMAGHGAVGQARSGLARWGSAGTAWLGRDGLGTAGEEAAPGGTGAGRRSTLHRAEGEE